MHLKELSLRGFKSFADRTVLKFEPGVTVIVGPNGTGKSNLTDALLWVLGEQSPRSLRGGAMEDVIFDGSLLRPSLGLAEVNVTLDNSDGQIPIEFTEVTIGRRVLRSGESEYLVNGSSVRLLDVQELLSDSGIGREMYSIVSQGRLEEILSAEPEERGILLEEAAGIYKYRKRKERAVKKLRSTKETLTRLQDVLSEIKRQLKPLEEQRRKAQDHQNIRAELREYELAEVVIELKQRRREWEGVKRSQDSSAERLNKLHKSRKVLERDIDSFQSQLEEKGVYAGDIGESRRLLQALNERLRAGLLLLEEKGKNLVQRLSELRQTQYRLEKNEKERSAELEMLETEAQEAAVQLKEAYSALSEEQQRTEQLSKGRAVLESEIRELRRETKEKEAAQNRIRDDLANLRLSRASFQSAVRRAAERGAKLKKEKLQTAKVLKEVAKECPVESCSLVEDVQRKAEEIDRELGRMKRKTGIWNKKLKEGEATGEQLSAESTAVSKVLNETAGRLEKLAGELEVKRHSEGEAKGEVHRLHFKVSSISKEEMRRKGRKVAQQKDLDEVRAEAIVAAQTLVALEGLRKRVQPLNSLYSHLLEAGREWAGRLEKMAAGEGALSQTILDDLKKSQGKSRELADEIERLGGEEKNLEVARAQIELRVNNSAKKIVDEWGLPLEEALSKEVSEDSREIKDRIQKLGRKLAGIGEVNPLAVKEWEAADERHEFLSSQVADLVKSRQSLNRIVKTVEKRMEKHFRQVFETINLHFREIFSYLFPGGSAEMTLVEGEEPGKNGVELLAQPSGKKFKKLSLLSGGERALTASAFFFALCRARPSPFYVLDEVEPSLDDVNLKRFLNLIDRYREATQFVIITHQRRTMEIADSLYGVSMQTDGVSKVISQRLSKEARSSLETSKTSEDWAPSSLQP